MAENPESEINKSMDPEVWAQESYHIASTFVYKHIKEGEAIQDNHHYIKGGLKLAEKRIATGGYRLANILESMALGKEATAEAILLFLQ